VNRTIFLAISKFGSAILAIKNYKDRVSLHLQRYKVRHYSKETLGKQSICYYMNTTHLIIIQINKFFGVLQKFGEYHGLLASS
jgi:hypothetical protein